MSYSIPFLCLSHLSKLESYSDKSWQRRWKVTSQGTNTEKYFFQKYFFGIEDKHF